MLAAWEDTVVNPLVDRLNAATRMVQAKKIDQEIKDHLKAMNQGPVKSFKAELGKAKRYLTKHESKERRTKTRGAVPEVTSRPAANPLWAIIHTLVESFKMTHGIGASIYEAKGGIRPCLLQPHPDCENITEMLNRNTYIKKLLKELAQHMKNSGSSTSLIHMNDAAKKKVG